MIGMSKSCSSERNSSGVNLIRRNILIARVAKPVRQKKVERMEI
jgi:hypothetical protein